MNIINAALIEAAGFTVYATKNNMCWFALLPGKTKPNDDGDWVADRNDCFIDGNNNALFSSENEIVLALVKEINSDIAGYHNLSSEQFDQLSVRKRIGLLQDKKETSELMRTAMPTVTQEVINIRPWHLNLAVGDKVYWNDPDEGFSSGIYTIVRIDTESGKVEDDDTVLALVSDAGSEAETYAYAAELTADGPCAVTLELSLKVTYVLNGEVASDMQDNLRRMCERAIGDGMLTGNSPAEVDEYSMEVREVNNEPVVMDPDADKMGLWTVEVSRTGYSREIPFEMDKPMTKAEAESVALEMAGNEAFSEYSSEYTVICLQSKRPIVSMPI